MPWTINRMFVFHVQKIYIKNRQAIYCSRTILYIFPSLTWETLYIVMLYFGKLSIHACPSIPPRERWIDQLFEHVPQSQAS
jgi:hypothetical protein